MNNSAIWLLTGLGITAVLLGASAVASAHDRSNSNWSISIGVPYATLPAPVYVQPPPIYYTPQPIYVQPAPVYVVPRPVLAPAYRTIYSPYPAPEYREYRWRRHHHHRHHDRDDD
jgi:hypothetical protein